MTDEDISVEYEAFLAFEGELLKTCHRCGVKTHRQNCPTCTTDSGKPMELTGDEVLDKLIADIEDGKDGDIDIEKVMREGWEPVKKDKDD